MDHFVFSKVMTGEACKIFTCIRGTWFITLCGLIAVAGAEEPQQVTVWVILERQHTVPTPPGAADIPRQL